MADFSIRGFTGIRFNMKFNTKVFDTAYVRMLVYLRNACMYAFVHISTDIIGTRTVQLQEYLQCCIEASIHLYALYDPCNRRLLCVYIPVNERMTKQART